MQPLVLLRTKSKIKFSMDLVCLILRKSKAKLSKKKVALGLCKVKDNSHQGIAFCRKSGVTNKMSVFLAIQLRSMHNLAHFSSQRT